MYDWVQIIDLILCPLFCIIYIALIILWYHRRYLKPLNARIPFFVYQILLVSIILTTFLTILGVNETVLPIRLYRFLQWTTLPLYMNVYLWECWRLYFVFQLSETRAIAEQLSENNRRRSESIATEHENETQLFTSLYESSWFVRHQKFVKETYLIKSFIIVGMVLWAGFVPLSIIDPNASRNFSYLLSIYVLVLIAMAIVIRKVKDAFGLKIELIGVAVNWTITLILTGALYSLEIPFATTVVIIAFFGGACFSVIFPLYLSYKYNAGSSAPISLAELEPGFDSGSYDLQSIPSVTSKKKSPRRLDGVMANDVLRDLFFKYLKLHFVVQFGYFWRELQGFKTDPRLFAGRAVLMYQKYLREGSFLDLQLPPELVEPVAMICENEQKVCEEGFIQADFFDTIETYAEGVLKAHLAEFKKTDTYKKAMQKMKDETRLEEGLNFVGVEVETK